MPELPEVESVRRRLAGAFRGRRIVAVRIRPDPLVFDGVTPARFAAALRGATVTGAGRWGKHLWLELDRRPWPLLHFGMTGWIDVYREGPPPRHWKFEMVADDGTRAALRDPRRFGRIRLRREPRDEPPLSRLGFDPLHAVPTARELHARLLRRRAPLKAVLLDQSVFAGVGNWIADEVLFQAALRPHRLASSLSLPEVRRLRARLLSVVQTAVDVDADSDRFPRSWLFHRRWGRDRTATTLGGLAIVHDTVGGRTTAWVPERQS